MQSSDDNVWESTLRVIYKVAAYLKNRLGSRVKLQEWANWHNIAPSIWQPADMPSVAVLGHGLRWPTKDQSGLTFKKRSSVQSSVRPVASRRVSQGRKVGTSLSWVCGPHAPVASYNVLKS